MNQPRGLLKLLKLDSLIHNLTSYMETRIALVKAEAKDDIMKAMRAAMIYGAIAVLALFFVLFLSFTIALAFNALLDSWFWGFAIVTGFYLIGLVVLYSLRNSEKVKNMFGDGSLEFLSKTPKNQENKEGNEDKDEMERERDEEILKEAERLEQTKEMEYEKVHFEKEVRKEDRTSPRGRSEIITVEKKETHQ